MPVRVRWRGLELPVRVKANEQTLTDRYGEFLVEPFERGFGHTVGSSLRRVLLSSLEGAAIVSARIHGVQQEFSSIKGVKEDVAEVMLNIKQIVVKLHPDAEKTLHIEVKKTGDVTAGDIEPDADVEIVNPGHKICTLTDKVEFKCTMMARKGRGYVPADELDLPREIGLVPIDALFSPVQRVAYRVEDTRVGRKTNYDRLVLQIWTNGSVEPEMALVEASKILRKHLNPFVEYFEMGRLVPQEELVALAPVQEKARPQVPESVLSMPVKALELSQRAQNCMDSKGIKTLGELLHLTETELLEIRNFGRITLQEIQEKLAAQGLNVGMLAPEKK